MGALRVGEADAYCAMPDGMLISQTALIIETASVRKLPTMFIEQESVAHGGLASYGVSYAAIGRLSARYVHQIQSSPR
jgi:ABC-type uncharacterized transport system substrate-binding protein